MADPVPADLRAAILAVLAPSGLRQRLRPPQRTLKELWLALPESLRPPAAGEGLAAEQRSLEALRQVMRRLEEAGEVRRSVHTDRVFLNTKGKRLVQVDRYERR